MTIVYVLWLREVKRFLRSRSELLGSIGQPLLFLLILGFGFGPVFEQAGRGDYVQFVAPGVISLAVLFTATFSGMGLVWDRRFGFLRETLVAPVRRLTIVLGRVLGGATIALIQGAIVLAVCLLAGFRPSGLGSVAPAFGFMALTAITFAALGTLIGSSLRDVKGFQLVMNFIVMPIFFLSGALFPLSGLPAGLAVATRLDPLTYGVDGLRAALIGSAEIGMSLDVTVLGGVAAVLLVLGAWAFSRMEV